MNLTKDHWLQCDITEFENYLLSLSKGSEKAQWEKRIVNTLNPCIAVSGKDVDKIVSQIYKGNFIEFINFWLWNNHTQIIINGKLISKIKNFQTLKSYLTTYANRVDCWADCDCLKLKIKSEDEQNYFDLAKTFIKSEKPFVKRIGLNILMKLLNTTKYLQDIFKILNSFKSETHYYVNMMVAWLTAECFAKHRNETLNFLQTHNLNKFTINKAISKCHDSFRVSPEDKQLLKTFRQ